MNHKDRTYCAVLGYFYGILQTSSIFFFGLPMIAAVIDEKTCDTPTFSLVEVFMINETFPVGQLYSRATFIQGIHLFSLKTPTLFITSFEETSFQEKGKLFLGAKTRV